MDLDGEHPASGSMVVPRYGAASLSDLVPSLLAAMGVPGERDVLGFRPARRVCLLLVDGLGWELLRDHRDEAPFLAGLTGEERALTAGFPSTTATSLASLGTGLTPGEHGMLGYQVAVEQAPATDRLLNCLRWSPDVDPRAVQPHPTAFERAAAAGVAVFQVAPAEFEGSGFTVAALRGARYVGTTATAQLAPAAAAALEASDRALVYAYTSEMDAIGHQAGTRSAAWRARLADIDRLVAAMAESLPRDAMLCVTADHGMVDVDLNARIDVDAEPDLIADVRLLGGEPRARHVYVRSGAAADVLAAWRSRLGDHAWIRTRDDAVSEGWFGPAVADHLLSRIGDVVVAARGGFAAVAGRHDKAELTMVGMHGSFTPAEQFVPLLTWRS